MTYELAQKLKVAGFPQGEYIVGVVRQIAIAPMVETEQAVYIPTLSELIEACGDKFNELYRRADGKWQVNVIYWGSTPEEAVTNLWLVLNKK